MKRVLQFSKLRFVMLVVSILLIGAGVAGVIIRGGFNLGIDFEAGLNMRVQIAPEVMSVEYTGDGDATLNVTGQGMEVSINDGQLEDEKFFFPFASYDTIGSLSSSLDNVNGIRVTVPENVSPALTTERIIGFNNPLEMEEEGVYYINSAVASEADVYASIDDIRTALMSIDIAQIQTVGAAENQEYIVRVGDPGEDKDFVANMSTTVEDLLGSKFGDAQVITKQSDYVGPRFSKNLGTQSIYLTALALALILVYIWIRFKLPYAVSAIVALAHDVLIMLGFIATFQLEVSTATMAAVLTIIGYSLNDTIVIFDRVRENASLLKDSDFKVVVNTSVTQSLSRTLITSLTTLLAVAAIYIFGTGAIKEFALNLIVGIVIGTYSSMFVASPILMGWMNTRTKKRKLKESQKYGVAATDNKKPKDEASASAASAASVDEGQPAAPKEPLVPKQLERQQKGQKRTSSKKKKKK